MSTGKCNIGRKVDGQRHEKSQAKSLTYGEVWESQVGRMRSGDGEAKPNLRIVL